MSCYRGSGINDLSGKVVYLSPEGARRLFGNPGAAGLPVIPSGLIAGTRVYHSVSTPAGAFVGGSVRQDAFTEDAPPDSPATDYSPRDERL